MSVGEVLVEAFVGNIVERFAASIADGGEVIRLECGNGAADEGGVVG